MPISVTILVARQRVLERGDDGNAATYARLEEDVDAVGAAAMTSSPLLARSALLAVTTLLPAPTAASTTSRADAGFPADQAR